MAATGMETIPFMLPDITRLNRTILCYAETIYRFNGLWEGPDPLTPLISLFLVQLTFSMAIIHLLVILLRPFNQPSFVAEIFGGILLGPSFFGRITGYRKFMFPSYSFKILEPMAHLSITYYAFLMGLKMDIKAILRTGPKATKIAISSTIIPFFVGSGLYFMFEHSPVQKHGSIFWGAALTVTGFSILVKILEKQQILHTEIGKTAAASALINDVLGWGFLALSFAITSTTYGNIQWSVITNVAYGLVCIYVIRPAFGWIIQKTPEGKGYSEFYICAILSGVALSGVITDVCGTHPMIGAFLFGLVIPHEVLEATIVDKLEDFVSAILMPVYFVVCGLRTNIDVMSHNTSWIVVVVVIIVLCSVKVVSCLFVCSFADLPFNEAVAVGLLTNAKSIMVLFILEAGQIQGVLNTQTYSIMVVAVLVMTMMVTLVAMWYRPVQNKVPYSRRTIQKAKLNEEFRVVACIHNQRNVPTVINILTTSNATVNSPMTVFALQLVELVGRASTMLLVHNSRKAGPRNPSHIEAQADQIITAFDNYELRSEGVETQVLTARCAYTTMDDDVCNIAKDRRAAFIIIPFHKQMNPNGEMEEVNSSIRNVNEGILANAPCSVGILIDGGVSELQDQATNIAMLYFGGPDDREALAYAWRMASNTATRLTVVRFRPSNMTAMENNSVEENGDGDHVTLHLDYEREKVLDDEYLGMFKTGTAGNGRIKYHELVLKDEEEAIKAIKSMDEHKHDLYLVGKGRGMLSPLTSGLADWCECPELGPIGDLLITSEFESKFSVLIVQQHIMKGNKRAKEEGSPRSPSEENFGEEVPMRTSVSDSEGFESFSSFRKWSHDDY